MRLRIVFLALPAAIPALSQTTSPNPPLLNTGLPNLFPTPPPPIIGASSTNPLLIPNPSQGAPTPGQVAGDSNPPAAGPKACTNPAIPCILTAQVNNSRQNVSLNEDVFTVAKVNTTFGANKQQFLVDNEPTTDHHPPGNYNPVYAQPLYVSNVTISIPGVTCTNNPCNILYVVSLNGKFMPTTPATRVPRQRADR